MEYLPRRFGGITYALTFFILLGANCVAAQELNIGGEVLVGYGWVDLESATPENTIMETSGPDGVGEAILNFAVKKGSFSARIEIEIDETMELVVAEHEVVWSVTKNLNLILSGQSFGIEPSDGNISVVSTAVGQVGDEEVFLDFSDAGLFNVELTLGGVIIGLASLDTCVPECGYSKDTGVTGGIGFPDSERMTTVVHLRGEAGGLSYNLYASASKGSFNNGSALLEGTGSGGGLGLFFKSGDFGFGLDVSTAQVDCQPLAGDSSCSEENTIDKWGVALILGGFAAHYYSAEDQTGSVLTETVNVDLVLTFEVGEVAVGPEIRITSTETADGVKTTDSFFLFGMAFTF